MVQTLNQFEDRFPDIENSRDGSLFKSDIKTACNDVIRAQRDEIYDYDIEYRPLRLNTDQSLLVTKSFMEAVQRIEFIAGDKPAMKIYASSDRSRVLAAARAEFGVGVIYHDSPDIIILEITGVDSCVNCVLNIMDKYRLHESVREQYKAWREYLVELYRS
jgi:hypothetical protein